MTQVHVDRVCMRCLMKPQQVAHPDTAQIPTAAWEKQPARRAPQEPTILAATWSRAGAAEAVPS